MKLGTQIREDVWIPTQCGRCYAGCGIRVRRVNGVAVKIEGNPDSTMGAEGGLCAKGESALQLLYDPNRLNYPLMRTNPEKGLNADPGWRRITWEEALNEIVPRLKKIIGENPKKLILQRSVMRAPSFAEADRMFAEVVGGPSQNSGGAGLHCGNGAHPVAGMVHASWSIVPDFQYCDYAIFFGASKGHGSGHSAMITAELAAQAKARGMRFVVFDPMCNFAGGKANEWVPILPGTDGAVVLAMVNIIVNELKAYDAVHLKAKTNAPYLVGPDGRYVRDRDSSKPLVWDLDQGRAAPYDHRSIPDYAAARTINYALEGGYEVNGIYCRPVFQAVREHLKQYSPEAAETISTVPAGTIRRIAAEFASAARVGSTITLGGHELPFRPASAVLFRGGEGHQNSHHTCFAIALLNQVVGSADVPGGTLGWPARSHGYPGISHFAWTPAGGKDGMLAFDHFGTVGSMVPHRTPWPVKMPETRNTLDFSDIFTLGGHFVLYSGDQEELWQKAGVDYRPEMLLGFGCNAVLSVASKDILAEVMKKIPFIAVHELFNNEFTEGFADIVLPATCSLEETSWAEGMAGQNFNHGFGMRDWCYHIVQPVVEPVPERKSWPQLLFELVDRLGKREEFNQKINSVLPLTPENRLQPDYKFTDAELGDRVARSIFGPEHGWGWFKEHGFLRWPKKVEEAYWRYFVDARVPIYLEYMVDLGERMKEIVGRTGLELELGQYTPLISWNACCIHREDESGYPLYCFSYRDVLHTGSHTMEQPWLDEASKSNPYTYNITMNSGTARKQGLSDGDTIVVETAKGRRVEGTLKMMEGQHPMVVGIAACSGHWSKGMPIARGKGTNFDTLLELDLRHIDPVSCSIETAVRVKVRKKTNGQGRSGL